MQLSVTTKAVTLLSITANGYLDHLNLDSLNPYHASMERFSVLTGRSRCGIAATPSSVIAVHGSRVSNRKPNSVHMSTRCNGFGQESRGLRRKRIVTARAQQDESLNWMSKGKSPYSVLGISSDCSEEDIKDAFRNRIKEFHPDVYKGTEDADAITQRIIRAYEILTHESVDRVSVERLYRRNNLDPFEVPECEAEDVFVFEMNCIGRGCPYSCVSRAPDVFKFAADTGCARAVSQRGPGQGEDYGVQLAVGQCPRNCIYWVTPMQRDVLENLMARAVEGTTYSSETVTLETLISRANYENGRYQPPKQKRQPTSTDQWVDWF